MDRMKTFLKYALWVVLFFIFSEFLINIGLNSSYKKMERRDNVSQVQIMEAKSTLVNGKLKGIITNSEEDYLTGKYLRIDYYSKRDILVGTKYIAIETNENNKTQRFNTYFELQEVTSYEVSIVDKKEEGEIELIATELTQPEIVMLTVITMLCFI